MRRYLLIFFLQNIALGQFDHITNGFGLDIGSSGSGIFFTRNYMHNSDKYGFNGEIRLYDIKAEEETIVYNPYSRQYEALGGKSLFMTPILFGVNYFPFSDKIANNFAPFLTLKAGANFIVDGKEFGSFFDRWSNPDYQFSYTGFIGCGIDFKWANQTSVMLNIGAEILPLSKAADGETNYSGLLIHISFNRLKK